MPKLFRNITPDDWLSALNSRQSLIAASLETSNGNLKQVIGLLFPIIIGAVLGLFLLDEVESSFVNSILSFCGVLAGFLVTLMLFTGRVIGTESLDYESAKEYRAKITYLLWSQMNTFFSLLITAVLCLCWTVLESKNLPNIVWVTVLEVSLIAFFSLAIFRAIILPFQIYELHRFSLDQLVEQKKDEVNSNIDDITFD